MNSNISPNALQFPDLALAPGALQSGKSSSKDPNAQPFDQHLRRATESRRSRDSSTDPPQSQKTNRSEKLRTDSSNDGNEAGDQNASLNSQEPSASEATNDSPSNIDNREEQHEASTEEVVSENPEPLTAVDQLAAKAPASIQDTPEIANDTLEISDAPEDSNSRSNNPQIATEQNSSTDKQAIELQSSVTQNAEQTLEAPNADSPHVAEITQGDQPSGEENADPNSVLPDEGPANEGLADNSVATSAATEVDTTAGAAGEEPDLKTADSETSSDQNGATQSIPSDETISDQATTATAATVAASTTSAKETSREKKHSGEEVPATAEVAPAAATQTDDSTITAEAKAKLDAAKATHSTPDDPTKNDADNSSSRTDTSTSRTLAGGPTAETIASRTEQESVSPTDRVRFVQRVANAIRTQAPRGGSLQLRLSPPELGSLKIELTLQSGTLSAKMETETQVARTAVLDNLSALRERLAEQGIKVEQFDVDVRDESQSRHDQSEAQTQQQQRERHNQPGVRNIRTQTSSAPIETTESQPPESRPASGQLNIIV